MTRSSLTVKAFLVALVLSSCQSPLVYIVSDKVPNQDIDIEFSTFDEAWEWVDENIEYRYDLVGEGKKFPEVTYRDRYGDCEDYAILLSYFAYRLGIKCDIVIISIGESYHAICLIDGKYLEPQLSGTYYHYEVNVVRVFTLAEALYSPILRSVR